MQLKEKVSKIGYTLLQPIFVLLWRVHLNYCSNFKLHSHCAPLAEMNRCCHLWEGILATILKASVNLFSLDKASNQSILGVYVMTTVLQWLLLTWYNVVGRNRLYFNTHIWYIDITTSTEEFNNRQNPNNCQLGLCRMIVGVTGCWDCTHANTRINNQWLSPSRRLFKCADSIDLWQLATWS